MPTVVTKTVGPTGRDYTSLSAAISGEAKDLVTADEQLVIECDAFVEDLGTGFLYIIGYTTDATRNIIIKAAAGAEHNGVFGAGYVLKNTSGTRLILCAEAYTELRGIELDTGAAYSFQPTAAPAGCVIDSCLVQKGTCYVSGNTPFYVRNTVFKDLGFTRPSALDVREAGAEIDNCTIIGYTRGIIGNNTVVEPTVRNTVAFGQDVESFEGAMTFNAASSNNAAEDTTAPGTSSVDSITTADFTDYAGGDYTPVPGGALYKAGTRVSGVTTDITGETVVYPSIGAFSGQTYEASFLTPIYVDPDKVPSDVGSGIGSAGFPVAVKLQDMPAAVHNVLENGSGSLRVFQDDGVTELPREAVSYFSSYFDNGINNSISISPITIVGDGVIFDAYLDWPGTSSRIVFSGTSFNDYLRFNNSFGIDWRIAGTTETISISSGLPVNRRFRLTVERAGSTGTIKINGQIVGTGVVPTADITIGRLLSFHNGSSQYAGNFYSANINGQAAYDARSIAGTTIADSIGSNDGTLEVVPTVVEENVGELHFLADHLSNTQFTGFHLHADGVSDDYPVDHYLGRDSVWVDYAGVLHGNSATINATGSGDFVPMGSGSGSVVQANGRDAVSVPAGTALVAPIASIQPDTPVTVQFYGTYLDENQGNFGGASLADRTTSGGRDFTVYNHQSTLPRFRLVSVLPVNQYESTNDLYSDLPQNEYFTAAARDNQNSVTAYTYKADNVRTTSGSFSTSNGWAFESFGVGGRVDSSPEYFGGLFWEARARIEELSADWLTTEYNNQSDTSSFYTTGTDSSELTHITDITINHLKVAGDLDNYTPFFRGNEMPQEFWDGVEPGGGNLRFYKQGGIVEIPSEKVRVDPAHLSFDGVDDVVEFTALGASPATWECEFTVALIGSGTSNDGPVIGHDSGEHDRIVVGWNSTGGTDFIGARLGGGTHGFDFPQSGNYSSLFYSGKLQTCRLVYDGTTLRAFLNGVESVDTSTVASIPFEDFKFFGRMSAGTFGEIKLSRFRVWDDHVRTSLIHDWEVTDGTSGTLVDNGSAGNNGTITGATTVAAKAEIHNRYLGTLPSTEDTVISVYAQPGLADYPVTHPFGREGVWVDYFAVLHMREEAFATQYEDATGNGHFAVKSGTITTNTADSPNGHVWQNFDGFTAEAILNNSMGLVPSTSDWTVSIWGKNAGTTDTFDEAMFGFDAVGETGKLAITEDSTGLAFKVSSTYFKSNPELVGLANKRTVSYVNETQEATGYNNAVSVGVFSTENYINNDSDLVLGRRLQNNAGDRRWEGTLADLRIRANAINDVWETTEYNNQSDPASFYSAAAPGAGGSGIPTLSAVTTTSVTFESLVPNVTVTF